MSNFGILREAVPRHDRRDLARAQFRPEDLPNETGKGGGDAPSTASRGCRWPLGASSIQEGLEKGPRPPQNGAVHARGTKGGPAKETLLSARVTRMTLFVGGNNNGESTVRPNGDAEDWVA